VAGEVPLTDEIGEDSLLDGGGMRTRAVTSNACCEPESMMACAASQRMARTALRYAAIASRNGS